jgi:iron complex outermembrane receptor protein
MRQIQYAVPSLHFGESYHNRNISIRGVGAFEEQPGVITSINGVVQPTDSSSAIAQLDLARVEILRGPQGTLYGRNANGGAVNFIAAKPTEEFFGRVKLGYADFDQTTAEIVLSGPMSESVGVRLAANHLDAAEGWVENLMPGEEDLMMGEKTNVRLLVSVELSDSLDAELLLGRSEKSGRWTHWAMIDENFDYGVMTGLPAVSYLNGTAGEQILFTEEPHKVYHRGPTTTDSEFDLYSMTLNWEVDGITVKSITAQQEWSDLQVSPADSTSLGVIQRTWRSESKTFTQEINISGQVGNLDWMIGGFYMDDESTNNFIVDFPVQALPFPFPFPYTPYVSQDRPIYTTESTAVFADATYAVSDRVRLGIGFRHTKEEKESGSVGAFGINAAAVGGFLPLMTFCPSSYPNLYMRKWEDTSNTMRASAEYDVTDTSMIYVSYSEGFKSGGANYADCNPPWNPETIEAKEIGYKASFADGSTSLRAALFFYDYADFQVLQVLDLAGIVKNAGDADISGLEVELTSAWGENWTINTGMTLLETEYGFFLNTDGLRPGAPYQNEGNPLNNAPDTSLNLGLTYEAALSSGANLSISLDTAHRSRVYFREFGLKEDSQSAYTIINFNANWESADRGFSARVFVNNLTDEEHITGMKGLQTTYGRQGTWNMPRQVGIEVTRFFGAR